VDRLVTSKEFPDPRPGETIQEYMPKYTRWITKELYSRTVFAINFLLGRTETNYIELVAPSNTGVDQDGNVRLTFDSNEDVILQVRISGTWTDSGHIFDVT
jgi:hypothetical protein